MNRHIRLVSALIFATVLLMHQAAIAQTAFPDGSTWTNAGIENPNLQVGSPNTATNVQFFWDIRNHNTVGGGSAMRFWDNDTNSLQNLGAVINCGLSDNTPGAVHGDCDFLTYKYGPVVETCMSLTSNTGLGLIPCTDVAYDLGSPTQRWRKVYAGAFVINGANPNIAPLGINFDSSINQGMSLEATNSSINGAPLLFRSAAQVAVGSVSFGADQGSVLYNITSDGRLKTVTGKLKADHAFDQLDAIRFHWKATGRPAVGFIAQDVAKIAPEAVAAGDLNPNGHDGDPGFKRWQMDDSKLVPYLWAEVKELRATVRADHAAIEKLKASQAR